MKRKKTKISDDELVETIEKISKKLAYKFRFGYHEIQDMKQQISIFALEGLAKYDYERPLENFLWTHVRNRLFNFKRDNYQRPDKPCLSCPLYDPHKHRSISGCREHLDLLNCEMFNSWYQRNNSKKNLMHLNTIEDLKEYLPQKNTDDDCSNNEIIQLIEENIIGEEREIYLRLKHGSKINKSDTNRLIEKIKEIIDDTDH